ncbi:MAG: hypothetical protein LBG44_10595 [Gemmatimonadota bacterium]|jgi:hypothetical protein|nr:hypothetical protein [Gemmatimonadota bacterium]
MITESEIGTIVELVLEELHGIIIRDGERDAASIMTLQVEIDEIISAIREPDVTRGAVLGYSLGLVDEFLGSHVEPRWNQIVHEIYLEYARRHTDGNGS